jgi:plastocyanin
VTRVKAGQNILVVNQGNLSHSLTSFKKGAFDTGVLSGGGADNSFVIKKPGTYRYYDQLNTFLQGEIIVSPK